MLEAPDGSEALAVILADRPDLIITDVLMPVMDGYELVRQLRLDPATSGIPVVFSTAHYGEREARMLALSIGVSAVLTKPVEAAEVLGLSQQAASKRYIVALRRLKETLGSMPGFLDEAAGGARSHEHGR